MPATVRPAELTEIAEMREAYRVDMNCQIIHDSIHRRRGWTREYLLEIDGGAVGYGSVAMAGPWRENNALYEFYVRPEVRMRSFDLFETLRAACAARIIETQSNDPLLSVMLHTFTRNIHAESILFEDAFSTAYRPAGAGFRAKTPDDEAAFARLGMGDLSDYVVTWNDEPVGAGGVLYHYNRPYGDLHMGVAEPFRRKGLGSYLLQELKAVCRAEGTVPAARCNIGNMPSRKTLQKAGFIPCGNIIVGDLSPESQSGNPLLS